MTRDDARRANLREHGEPDSGVYFGRDPRRPIGDGVLVSIAREARTVRLRDSDGTSIAAFGETAMFWLAAASSDPALAARPAGPAAPTLPREAAPLRADQAATSTARLTAGEEYAARTAALATSYRLTAESITAAGATPVPMRQTWAAAGHPATFLYYERGIQPGRPILATTTDGYRIYDARTDQLIAHFASPVKMWIADPPRAVAPTPRPVVVVGCGKAKAPGRLPAGRKYVGGLHKAARRAADVIAARTGGQVLILSARYGLITLDTEVDDYDVRLGDPDAVTPARIVEQAAALGITGAAVTVLAGRRYADLVSQVWPDAARPLDGAGGIGNQLARLKAITQQPGDGLRREQHGQDGPA